MNTVNQIKENIILKCNFSNIKLDGYMLCKDTRLAWKDIFDNYMSEYLFIFDSFTCQFENGEIIGNINGRIDNDPSNLTKSIKSNLNRKPLY